MKRSLCVGVMMPQLADVHPTRPNGTLGLGKDGASPRSRPGR